MRCVQRTNDMQKTEKTEFVTALCKRVRDNIVDMINRDFIPDNWDGKELRSYVSHCFELRLSSEMRDKRSTRYKDYQNDIIVKNL